MSRKILLLSLLAFASLGIAVEAVVVLRQRERLAAHKKDLLRLEAQVKTARVQRDETLAAQRTANAELAALRLAAQEREARGASVKAWWRRIEQLQRRLNASPAEKIPELKLLTMKDWIDAVLFAETASEEQIRKLFATLRTRARSRFATQLPEALRRFTDASGGELPIDVLALAPFLTPPGDAAMLASYRMTRSGKIGDRHEIVVVSTDSEGGQAKIGLDTASWSDSTAVVTNFTERPKAIGGEFGDERLDEFGPKHWATAMEALGPQVGAALESLDEKFGERLKAAVRDFTAAQGSPPKNFAQLRATLPELDRIATLSHPVRAQFEYMIDHAGKLADDPEKLRPYLERPIDPERLLRAFKLTMEGNTVTMEYKFD